MPLERPRSIGTDTRPATHPVCTLLREQRTKCSGFGMCCMRYVRRVNAKDKCTQRVPGWFRCPVYDTEARSMPSSFIDNRATRLSFGGFFDFSVTPLFG